MNAAPHTPPSTATPPQSPWPPRPTLSARAVWHVLVGRRAPAQMAQIRTGVAGHPAMAGRQVVWHVPAQAPHTPEVARQAAEAALQDGGVVVAIGGDGTINAAAQACWQRCVPIGVLSHGTFNFFSRQHGLASELADGLDQLTRAMDEGLLRPVVPGQVNGQTFLVNASVGLYPRLLAEREAATRQFGRSRLVALLAGVLSVLRFQGGQVLRLRERDEHGRERLRMTLANTLFVGNNALQLAQVGVAEAEQAGRRRLVATTLAPRGLSRRLAMLWKAARGRLGEHEAVDSFSCTALTVEPAGNQARGQVRVAFDGERSWMSLPLRFEVAHKPLWLVAPRLGQGARA